MALLYGILLCKLIQCRCTETESGGRYLHPQALEARAIGKIESPLAVLEVVFPLSNVSAIELEGSDHNSS